MEGTPQTPPTGGSLGVQDGPCSDPSRALLREKAVSQHWKGKALKLGELVVAQEAENKLLQRQLSALQAAAHGGGSVPVTPTADGGSADSTAPWQADAPSRTVAQLSLAQLRLLQGELEQARAGLQAQAEQLAGVREDYEARKRCLKEAAGAARREVLSLQSHNQALQERNDQLAAWLEQARSAARRPPPVAVGGQSPAAAGVELQQGQQQPGDGPSPTGLRAVLARREGEVSLLQEDSRAKEEELLRALAQIQASHTQCEELRRQADNLGKQLRLTAEALEAKDVELEELRADLEEREGALQQLLAVCEAQVASAAAAAAAEAKERAAQLQTALEQQQQATAEAGEQAAELRAALASQEQAAAEAAGRATGLQAALAQQEQAVAEAGERVVELQEALALRAQAIEQLQQEVEGKAAQVLALEAAAASGAEERRRLEADLEAQAVHINLLQAQVADLPWMQERLQAAKEAEAALAARLESAVREAHEERAARLALEQRSAVAERAAREQAGELEAAAGSAEDARAAVASLSAELEVARRQLDAQAAELAGAQAELAQVQQQAAEAGGVAAAQSAALAPAPMQQQQRQQQETEAAAAEPAAHAEPAGAAEQRGFCAGAACAGLLLAAAQRQQRERRAQALQARVNALQAQRAVALRRLHALQHDLAEAELLLAPLCCSRPASRAGSLAASPARGAVAALGLEGADMDASVAAAVAWLQEGMDGPDPLAPLPPFAAAGSAGATPRQPSRLALRIRRLLAELAAAQRGVEGGVLRAHNPQQQQAGPKAELLRQRLGALKLRQGGEDDSPQQAEEVAEGGGTPAAAAAAASPVGAPEGGPPHSPHGAVSEQTNDSASELHSPALSTASTVRPCGSSPGPSCHPALPMLTPVRAAVGQQAASSPSSTCALAGRGLSFGGAAAATEQRAGSRRGAGVVRAHPLPPSALAWQEQEAGEACQATQQEGSRPAALGPRRANASRKKNGRSLPGALLRTLLLAPVAVAGSMAVRALQQQGRR